MSESRIDRVSISKEAQVRKPAGPAPSWIPPVLKRFYDFTRKWAGTFSKEFDEDKRGKRETEFVNAVTRSFKGEV
jgi:hypothetical protein